MFKTWLKKYSLPVLLCLSIAVLLVSQMPPKECILCTEAPHHAPCLLNLSTGEIGELTVYDTNPFNSKTLSDEQTTGTFSFLHCAGLIGYRDTACELCRFDIPCDADKYEPSYFCRRCRNALASYRNHAFVLVDTFEAGEPLILPISKSVTYEMRCYRISAVYSNEHDRYELTVSGTLILPE